uniref:UBA domain-containing protein n=1 Tax=Micrurus spixii TaxID=129469 RepID=A0A2D4LC97_9SAUR
MYILFLLSKSGKFYKFGLNKTILYSFWSTKMSYFLFSSVLALMYFYFHVLLELQRDPEVSSPENVNNPSLYPEFSRHSPGNSLAGGLVKGALSVAASAYKALFVGQASMDQALSVTCENQMASYLSPLHEMGFCDRHLNLHLLQKHKFDMNLVVTELLRLNQGDWNENPY